MEAELEILRKRVKELEAANDAYAALELNHGLQKLEEGPKMEGPRPRKDLSLMALVAPWTGDESSTPVQQFLQGIELIGASGNWEDKDLALVTRTRLKGQAAAFLASRPELQGPAVEFETLKVELIGRFRDRTTPQQYLLMLNTITQGSKEQVRAFADRCRAAGQRALIKEGDEAERRGARLQIDKVVLTAFMKGLRGELGKMIRLNPPHEMEEAVARATVMEQELTAQGTPDIFCVEARDLSTNQTTLPCQECDSREERVVRAIRRKEVLCFRCRKPGHLARNCPTAREVGRSEGNCYRCGSSDHWARSCPRPQNKKVSPNGVGLRSPPFLGRQ